MWAVREVGRQIVQLGDLRPTAAEYPARGISNVDRRMRSTRRQRFDVAAARSEWPNWRNESTPVQEAWPVAPEATLCCSEIWEFASRGPVGKLLSA
jgi:hypothetical protein